MFWGRLVDRLSLWVGVSVMVRGGLFVLRAGDGERRLVGADGMRFRTRFRSDSGMHGARKKSGRLSERGRKPNSPEGNQDSEPDRASHKRTIEGATSFGKTFYWNVPSRVMDVVMRFSVQSDPDILSPERITFQLPAPVLGMGVPDGKFGTTLKSGISTTTASLPV